MTGWWASKCMVPAPWTGSVGGLPCFSCWPAPETGGGVVLSGKDTFKETSMATAKSMRRGWGAGIAAATIALSGLAASAQPSGGKQPQQPSAAAVEQATREPLVTVEFKGGTCLLYTSPS